AANRRALTLLEDGPLPPEHPYLAAALLNVGGNLVELGRHAEALLTLERARETYEGTTGFARELAQTRLALARALWDGGGDRNRARSLARHALDGFGNIGAGARKDAAAARAWLSTHR
ncbi:MAG: tetratricopeptide repeat protein, partial [Deltaproteobacteria bacterium]|nr:tetratricopeptide repeat protein [Deltaproteobacteria bacterium]